MEILDLLERIRAINVRALALAMEENAPCHVEPVLRDEDGEVAVEGPFNLPCRVDALLIEQDSDLGESVMVDPPTRLEFEKLSLVWNALPVVVHPFGWDYAEFSCDFSEAPDWSPLTSWFWRYLDPDDENEESAEGLYGVLHYLSDPVMKNGKATFTVDFGSVGVAAFQELIRVLGQMGARHVVVG